MKKVLTICPYCGCGCALYLVVEDNRIAGVVPCPAHPVSEGKLCVKGWTGYEFVNSHERPKAPLIRKKGKLVQATWDEALTLVSGRPKEIRG